jgi:adenine-specific DNA-methyltransferase
MPESPEKLDLRSLDVAADKRRLLHQLFPEVFTESTGVDGNPAVLDFEKLKAVLGEHVELATPGQERYGLEWPGKRDALKAVQASSLATLIPAPEESVDWDTTQNVFIEGDNLEVLKLLQKSYYGKVKMIYIDPPYNTGNDFVYPDNYAESLDTYLRYTGKIDDQGFKTTTNSKDSGRFHSNWLRMMYPRLYVAKNLLREDGVIFISIDDNEAANLRQLCDQIFGPENFIEQFTWKKSYGGGPKEKYAVTQHEYVLLYCKSINHVEEFLLTYDQEKVRRYYKLTDEHYETRGPFRLKPLEATKSMDARPNLIYPIVDEDGESIYPERQWLWSKDRVAEELKKGGLKIIKTKNGKTVNYKQYLKDTEGEERGEKPFSIIDNIFTQQGTDALRQLFSGELPLQFPKPPELIKFFVRIATENKKEKDPLILDFFAGSGTTQDAVSSANLNDGLNRRCISVQLPEPCDESSEAFKAGFKTIADIAKERIRRAGAKIREEHEAKLKADASEADLLTPQTSKDNPSSTLDTGFRVFKLAPSNFKRWDGEAAAGSKEALVQQMEATLDHIAAEATEDSLLFEILLKAGYQLTCPLEKLTLAGRTVWSVDGGSLFVCVEDRIDSALVDAVAEKHPVQFICLDRALQGSDSLKVNTLETFRAAQPEIQFRTV